ncbi:MAG TPA: hypothetical protein VIT88_04100 [Pyrinomonadaceae bacterium]
MTPESDTRFEVESQAAYAVYDSESGAIAHLHMITTFRGGEGLPVDQHEGRALEMAKRMGHDAGSLRVVKVDRDGLKPGLQRIDLKSLKLVEDEELVARAREPVGVEK